MTKWNSRMAGSLQLAAEAVRIAGKEVLSSLSGLRPEDITEKGPNDFVTRVDKASEDTLRRIIGEKKIRGSLNLRIKIYRPFIN